MFLSRLHRRITTWVALLTLVLGALAPTVAQALVAGSDRADWLQEGMVVTVRSYDGQPLSVSIPDTVALAVVEADAVVKGQTASSSYKPAIANNGVRIMIPPYMGVGERIIVDTTTGEYVRRAE